MISIPYSRESRYHHFRQNNPSLFEKKSFRTIALNHTKYRGNKFAKFMYSGTPAKAIVGTLIKSGKKGSIQSILIPKDIIQETYKTFSDAKKFHKKRSKISRTRDESKTSKKKSYIATKNWFKNPGSSDIIGIDTKKEKAKSTKEVKLYLISTYNLYNKLLNKNNFSKEQKNKILLTTISILNKKNARIYIQNLLDIRYNNTYVRQRNKSRNNKDFWIFIR